MPSRAEALYTRVRDAARVAALFHSGRATFLSLGRVVAIGGVIGLAILTRVRNLGNPGWGGVAVLGAAFVVLVIFHDRVLKKKDVEDRRVAWAEAGLARLADRWSHPVTEGDPKNQDGHPYGGDLDLFGERSLFQSLDTTRTREGRALLASWLRAGATPAEIRARQSGARALALESGDTLREGLGVEGALLGDDPPELAPLLTWAEKTPEWNPGPLVQVVALVLPAFTMGHLLLGGALPMLPRWLWLVSLGLQIALTTSLRPSINASIEACSNHQGALARFEKMFAVVEGAKLDEPSLVKLRASMEGASADSRALAFVVSFVDARRNDGFRLFIGPMLAWDLNCALALERWRRRAGVRLRAHLSALSRIEALTALSTRAFERPEDAFPEIVEDAVTLDAKALAHPLLPRAKVVANDVTLEDEGSILLVTGSNMSGKSTLLRAVGTNVVLALAGAPVRAQSMRCSPFAVQTSMRVSDSLSDGVSHFLAELLRLKAVVDAADDATKTMGPPVLFLLDEILHGTNSRERHLGARAIVRHLVAARAAGAVSTHDLALAALETECPGKVKNVHFREQVGPGPDGKETMTFDYRLRTGVVDSSNALRLMRIVGIDVTIPEESAGESEAVAAETS